MREGPEAEALRVRSLTRRYGRVAALERAELSVAAGEAFGLVGANGAGKTTLIKCILDLARPDSGEVALFGVPSTRPEARRRLAYLPERFAPPHYLRGAEFLRTACALAGAAFDAGRAASLCEALELEREALARPVGALSKGMTQKLGLAACFLVERDLYVLDEPMSGLDPAARVAVKSALRRLSAESRTVFFTSHVLADVEELCASIAVLDRGRVRFRGTPAGLCERTGEPGLERAFMRCIRDDERAASA